MSPTPKGNPPWKPSEEVMRIIQVSVMRSRKYKLSIRIAQLQRHHRLTRRQAVQLICNLDTVLLN